MDDFTRAAVIGIGGLPALPPIEPELAPLLGDAEHPRERQFLLLAGARSIYRAAGLEAPHVAQPAAAGEESLPACSNAAASILSEVLQEKDEDLCTELAYQLRAAGLRAPFAILPALLSVRTPQARHAVRAIAGSRGLWLAALRDEWRWLLAQNENAPLPARSRWQEGTLDERKTLLASVRALQPPVAREWLLEVWKEESAENRAAFLALLEANISADDEDFVEKALADRSIGVRAIAATLLAKIPSSRFLQRCLTRATEVLRFETKTNTGFASMVKAMAGKERRSLKLICEPPSIDDPLGKELGSGKGGPGVGARAQILTRLVSLIDPRTWEERAAATPEEILQAAGGTDWLAPLAEGFARATLLHARGEWHLPLLRLAGLSEELIREDWVTEVALSLSAQDAEQMVLELLNGQYPKLLSQTDVLLGALPSRWSPELSHNALIAVRRILARGGDGDEPMTWAAALPRIARGIHPAAFDDALREWTLGETYYGPLRARQLEQLDQIVGLRKRFYQEIKRD